MSFENIPLLEKIKTFLVTSAGFLLDGYDLSVISFASTIIREQLNLTPFEYGLLLSASLMGMIPGSLVFGYLSDKVGKKSLD